MNMNLIKRLSDEEYDKRQIENLLKFKEWILKKRRKEKEGENYELD